MTRRIRIAIVPLEEGLLTLYELARTLSRVYTNAVINVVEHVVTLPSSAYDPVRKQYRSEYIVYAAAELRDVVGAEAVLVVAGVDAYADGLNFVFGEALLGQGIAVVYTPRLRPEFYGSPPDRELFMGRLLKEAMHELGHAFGLGHCPNPLCVMSFSNSILEVDYKRPAYCAKCAARLRGRGVIVSEKHILH